MGHTFVSVDVEADGPIPGKHSMLSFGATLVENPHVKFYAELKPISEEFDPEALAVSGLNRDKLKLLGKPAEQAMREFRDWLEKHCKKGKPKFVGFPLPFDWKFIDYYFLRFLGENPFGINGVDIRSVLFGMFPAENAFAMRKDDIKAKLGVTSPHTHNALDDAFEQGEMFAAMLRIRNGNRVELQ